MHTLNYKRHKTFDTHTQYNNTHSVQQQHTHFLYSYMPDMLSVRVVGRLPKAKRYKLYHLLEDEGPKHVYQTSVELQR